MTQVFIADSQPTVRAAFRLLLQDLAMRVVGEAADWPSTLALVPTTRPDIVVIDWELLPPEPSVALTALRRVCPTTLVIVLISHLDAREQAARGAGADMFISKSERPDRVAERLRAAARNVRAV